MTRPVKSSRSGPVTRGYLAMRVGVHPNIQFRSAHVSGKVDHATADWNMLHSVLLLPASRSAYENAPGGEVRLSAKMLGAMLKLADTYSFRVTEIAGGSHSKHSRHYQGVAFDVDQINGAQVSKANKHCTGFMQACRKLGATEVLGPGSKGHDGHVHAAWPRDSD